jgi:DNA-binding transcriptional ArsR family regulator
MICVTSSTLARVIPAEESLDLVFGALADPTRRSLLSRLAEGPATVTELAKPFAVSLPAISRHLKVLESAGLLRRERDGKWHRIALDSRPLEPAIAFLARHRAMWEGNLDQLASYLEKP